MGKHASYEVVRAAHDQIFIKDLFSVLGEDEQGLSVTNDAEWVVRRLHETYGLSGKTVYYRDSEGRIDQIRHRNGVFQGFAAGSEGLRLS